MSLYVADSALFRDQFSTQEMREIFDDHMTLQKWLDVEVALARAQAMLGMIPETAADEISKAGNAGTYDLASLKAEMDRTSHPIVPLVRAMEKKCAGDAGGYIHWGATTQDIMETGQTLQLKDAWQYIDAALETLEGHLAQLAGKHRDTPMAGRTHGQHALPLTFGYKVAIWLDEVRRHRRRMQQAGERLFVGQFSGAVGTMAAIGTQGLAVQEQMMALLDLGVPVICQHVARDVMAEAAFVIAAITGTMGKIAHEIFLMSKTELAEVEEPFPPGKVGSSTMPHKRNPAICESIVVLARTSRHCVTPALENLIAENERDKIGLQVEREYMARLHGHAHAAVKKTNVLISGLNVKAENMRCNLDTTGGLLLSEAVMMALAPVLGRQRAHELVYAAAQKAAVEGHTMKEALQTLPEVTEKLSSAEIEAMLDPAAYTGLSAEFVDRVLNRE